MKDSRNFGHLAEFDPPLAVFGTHAEQYFVDDANTALIKTRQFAEWLANLVAERTGIELTAGDTFSHTLGRLRSADVVPRDVLDVLHRLRIDGNDAAHGFEGERRRAFEAIKLCHRLGVRLLATLTGVPGLSIAFVPPRVEDDDATDLKAQHAALLEEFSRQVSEKERAEQALEEAEAARLDAEGRARLAEEESEVYEVLAHEAEARAARPEPPSTPQVMAFATAARRSARDLDPDEADTRVLVDAQLRAAGWEADSATLRHGKGARPARGKNLAIAEWPTASGPADYALFLGTQLVGVVEAKRRRRNVPAALDDQSHRYARDVEADASFEFAGGPWGEHKVPFVFAANGRGYNSRIETEGGIWFRDARGAANPSRALEGWPTPTWTSAPEWPGSIVHA